MQSHLKKSIFTLFGIVALFIASPFLVRTPSAAVAAAPGPRVSATYSANSGGISHDRSVWITSTSEHMRFASMAFGGGTVGANPNVTAVSAVTSTLVLPGDSVIPRPIPASKDSVFEFASFHPITGRSAGDPVLTTARAASLFATRTKATATTKSEKTATVEVRMTGDLGGGF